MVAKVSQASKLVKAAHAISFTPDSANVLVVGQDRTLTAVNLSTLQVTGTLNWGQNTEGSTNATLRTLAVSSDGKYVALGDTHNRIQVFELSTMKVSSSQKKTSFLTFLTTLLVCCLFFPSLTLHFQSFTPIIPPWPFTPPFQCCLWLTALSSTMCLTWSQKPCQRSSCHRRFHFPHPRRERTKSLASPFTPKSP